MPSNSMKTHPLRVILSAARSAWACIDKLPRFRPVGRAHTVDGAGWRGFSQLRTGEELTRAWGRSHTQSTNLKRVSWCCAVKLHNQALAAVGAFLVLSSPHIYVRVTEHRVQNDELVTFYYFPHNNCPATIHPLTGPQTIRPSLLLPVQGYPPPPPSSSTVLLVLKWASCAELAWPNSQCLNSQNLDAAADWRILIPFAKLFLNKGTVQRKLTGIESGTIQKVSF
jgi:hypothetical protein